MAGFALPWRKLGILDCLNWIDEVNSSEPAVRKPTRFRSLNIGPRAFYLICWRANMSP
jgi:hypothetical protein